MYKATLSTKRDKIIAKFRNVSFYQKRAFHRLHEDSINVFLFSNISRDTIVRIKLIGEEFKVRV